MVAEAREWGLFVLLPLLQSVELIKLRTLLQLPRLLRRLLLFLLLQLLPLLLPFKLLLLLRVSKIAGVTGRAAVASSPSGCRTAAEE